MYRTAIHSLISKASSSDVVVVYFSNGTDCHSTESVTSNRCKAFLFTLELTVYLLWVVSVFLVQLEWRVSKTKMSIFASLHCAETIAQTSTWYKFQNWLKEQVWIQSIKNFVLKVSVFAIPYPYPVRLNLA